MSYFETSRTRSEKSPLALVGRAGMLEPVLKGHEHNQSGWWQQETGWMEGQNCPVLWMRWREVKPEWPLVMDPDYIIKYIQYIIKWGALVWGSIQWIQSQDDRAPRADNAAEAKLLGLIRVQGYDLLFLFTYSYQLFTCVLCFGFYLVCNLTNRVLKAF